MNSLLLVVKQKIYHYGPLIIWFLVRFSSAIKKWFYMTRRPSEVSDKRCQAQILLDF